MMNRTGMIVVTGGAGFIGSNIVKGLNDRGIDNILVVDDLSDGAKFNNIVDLRIADYCDKDEFINKIKLNEPFQEEIGAIFHEGACSDTTEWDGHFMMENNYEYSKTLLAYAAKNNCQFLYASSAAVYGGNETFVETSEYEAPLNMYGYSKMLFDHYVRRYYANAKSQIVGFRYFNVYGPREQHKGGMASVAYHLNQQIQEENKVRLFAGTGGYDDGEQRRDFIYIDDVVAVNLWFFDNINKSGIFNVGTGRSQPFNDIAKSVIAWHERGEIEYIPFPDKLKGRYQSFTQANITKLRQAGYAGQFKTVEQGVHAYLDCLNKTG